MFSGHLPTADDTKLSGYIYLYFTDPGIKTLVHIEGVEAVILNVDFASIMEQQIDPMTTPRQPILLDGWNVESNLHFFFQNWGVKRFRVFNLLSAQHANDERLSLSNQKWSTIDNHEKYLLYVSKEPQTVLLSSQLKVPINSGSANNIANDIHEQSTQSVPHSQVAEQYKGRLTSSHFFRIQKNQVDELPDKIATVSYKLIELAKMAGIQITNPKQMTTILMSTFSNVMSIERIANEILDGQMIGFTCSRTTKWYNLLYLITEKENYKREEVSNRIREFHVDFVRRNNLLPTNIDFDGMNMKAGGENDYCYL